MEWIAENSDGWIMYPRSLDRQKETVRLWQQVIESVAPGVFKPFVQSLYIDLRENPDEPPTAIHLGIRGGRRAIFRHLDALRSAGVHHVILNLKYGSRDASEVLQELGKEIIPELIRTQPAQGADSHSTAAELDREEITA